MRIRLRTNRMILSLLAKGAPFSPLMAATLLLALIGGCQNTPPTTSQNETEKDGAPDVVLLPSEIEDATPQFEPKSRYGNHSPYTVLGKTYEVSESVEPLIQEGIASWYGTKFHGKRTSSWETYDMFAMTAAHRSLPLPTYVKVTNLKNRRSTIVKVNDRGPFHSDRVIDLSYAAAVKLGFARQGTAPVKIEAIPMSHLLDNESTLTVQKHSLVKQQPSSIDKTVKPAVNRLFIQVGAYSSRDRAAKIEADLEEWITLPVNIHKAPQKRLYRVQIGPLKNSVQAQTISQLLAKEFDIMDPMLVWN